MPSPPLKRARTHAPHQPARFLARHTEDAPLAILLSPLRKRQGRILTRNLSHAGANIVDVACLPSPPPPNLLVITDSVARAQTALPAANPSTNFISTEWASKLLSTQAWHSPQPYLLTPASQPPSPSQQPTQHSPPPSSAPAPPLLPIWCTQPIPPDPAAKRSLLDSLPHFLCQRSTYTQALYPSPNAHLCDLLEQLAQKRILERAGGSTAAADIRARAYRLASAALKCVPFRLQSRHDALTLHAFGPRVLAIVDEYLTTGQVNEVERFHNDPRLSSLYQLSQLYGIGPAIAFQLYQSGIRTVEQLITQATNHPCTLPNSVVRFVVHQDRLSPTTTLDTARAFCAHVSKLCDQSPSLNLRITLCGGFRRGQPSGHDVDLLYCRRSSHAHDTTSVITQVIDRLKQAKLLTNVLTLHHNSVGLHERRFNQEAHSVYPFAHDILHGIATYSDAVFRLDIVGVRCVSEYPFATLAWSGSTAFQRDLRQWAQRKNCTFNQHGLFDRATGKRLQLTPEPKSEHDIFTALDLIYRPPFERSC